MEDSSRFTRIEPNLTQYRPGKARVLLREPESCWECGRIYISLYPLKHCDDHEDLDRLH